MCTIVYNALYSKENFVVCIYIYIYNIKHVIVYICIFMYIYIYTYIYIVTIYDIPYIRPIIYMICHTHK